MIVETEVALRTNQWFTAVTCLFALLIGVSGCALHHTRSHSDLIRYGIELAEKGYWTEAAIQWRMVLEEDPSNAAALNNLGVAAEIDNHPQEARQLLFAALKEQPDNTHIKQNLVSVKEREEKETTREADEDETKK
ncbi:MAG TPA: hypothetical protein PLV45_09340 [bacterium]|nr:hypothetical protein [bacterium]